MELRRVCRRTAWDRGLHRGHDGKSSGSGSGIKRCDGLGLVSSHSLSASFPTSLKEYLTYQGAGNEAFRDTVDGRTADKSGKTDSLHLHLLLA
ncbi:unnamed protein product [Ophioblennius macclurei]